MSDHDTKDMSRPLHADRAWMHPKRAKLPHTSDYSLPGYVLSDLLRPNLSGAVMHAKRTELSDDSSGHVQWSELSHYA